MSVPHDRIGIILDRAEIRNDAEVIYQRADDAARSGFTENPVLPFAGFALAGLMIRNLFKRRDTRRRSTEQEEAAAEVQADMRGAEPTAEPRAQVQAQVRAQVAEPPGAVWQDDEGNRPRLREAPRPTAAVPPAWMVVRKPIKWREVELIEPPIEPLPVVAPRPVEPRPRAEEPRPVAQPMPEAPRRPVEPRPRAKMLDKAAQMEQIRQREAELGIRSSQPKLKLVVQPRPEQEAQPLQPRAMNPAGERRVGGRSVLKRRLFDDDENGGGARRGSGSGSNRKRGRRDIPVDLAAMAAAVRG